jgi:hypothetical protein
LDFHLINLKIDQKNSFEDVLKNINKNDDRLKILRSDGAYLKKVFTFHMKCVITFWIVS